MIKTLFVSIVGGLAIWFAQDYFRDVPKVYYSISNPIEIPSSSGSTEYAQEVSIANLGRSNVKDVAIRAPLPISSYKLTKHSSLVKEGLGTDPKNFELVYPELPVGQRFTLLLRYAGAPIEKKLIAISHASGAALDQENNNGSFTSSWLLIAFILGALLPALSDFRRFGREAFIRWVDVATVYRNDKPWFVSMSEWPALQFDAIQRVLSGYDPSLIEQSESFKLLKSSKPKLLDEERWATLVRDASKNLMAKFSKELTAYTSIEKLLDLSRVVKPDLLSSESWKEVQKSLSNCIFNNLLHTHVSEKELVEILENDSTKLRGVPNEVADLVRKSARDKYCHTLLERCQDPYRARQGDALKSARLDLLNESQKKKVSTVANQFERMLVLP